MKEIKDNENYKGVDDWNFILNWVSIERAVTIARLIRQLEYEKYIAEARIADYESLEGTCEVYRETILMSQVYWEARYKSGRDSGAGSAGKLRDWKWKIIESYSPKMQQVLDVGCGDLRFWYGRECWNYTGVDFSPTIIEHNRKLKPNWNFILSSASDTNLNLHRYDVVFCFDTLFHVMVDSDYYAILKNLCDWTGNWLFIYTWERNPLGTLYQKLTDRVPIKDAYEYFRDLRNDYGMFTDKGLSLVGHFDKKHGAMYVFKRIS